MVPALSVVLDHLQSDVGELRVMLAAPGPLTPDERVDAVEDIKAASAALTNLGSLLHRADRRIQRRWAMPALNIPRHSCDCLCAACEQQGAGYFAQRAALAGESHAAERLSPSQGRRPRSRRPPTAASHHLDLYITRCFFK